MFPELLFVVGFAMLIRGADWFVEGASSLALRFRIPPLVIGLTIVSLGTSAPETLISVTASWHNHTHLSLGNVFGSIISNTLLGLGLAATLAPLKVQNSTVWKEIPFLLFTIVLLGLMALSPLSAHHISQWEGAILLMLFVLFLIYTIALAKNKNQSVSHADIPMHSPLKSVLLFGGGLLSLMLGSHWTVGGAITIAQYFGISESLIGLTIIAIGTSLPEIITAATASLKGHADMALGNVVGANIFNVLWILGLSSSIRQLEVLPIALQACFFAAFVTMLLLAFLWTKKNRMLSRVEGILFLALYAIYTGYLILF